MLIRLNRGSGGTFIVMDLTLFTFCMIIIVKSVAQKDSFDDDEVVDLHLNVVYLYCCC